MNIYVWYLRSLLKYSSYLNVNSQNWNHQLLRHPRIPTLLVCIFDIIYTIGIIIYLGMYFFNNRQQNSHDESIFSSLPKVNHCFIYIIGIINFLGQQLYPLHWMYLTYQLHNWYYHLLRHKIYHTLLVLSLT